MPTLRALFGLGITSPVYASTRLQKYKAVTSLEVVTAATKTWPSKAKVVIVTGLNVFARFTAKMQPTQVIVVSDIPSLLSCIDGLVPLDYSRKVSYIFNYCEPDFIKVTKAIKQNNKVDVAYNKVDQLGYVINNLKKSDDTINSLIGLLSNIGFSGRNRIYLALDKFFTQSKPDINIVIEAIDKEAKDATLETERIKFTSAFCDNADAYHQAYNSGLATANAAQKFEVDSYALSYFKTKLNALEAPKKRLAKQPSMKGLHNGKRSSVA